MFLDVVLEEEVVERVSENIITDLALVGNREVLLVGEERQVVIHFLRFLIIAQLFVVLLEIFLNVAFEDLVKGFFSNLNFEGFIINLVGDNPFI